MSAREADQLRHPPDDAESRAKATDAPSLRAGNAAPPSARLTVDITRALGGRIKIAAFQRGETVADMLRDLLAPEFPATDGGKL